MRRAASDPTKMRRIIASFLLLLLAIRNQRGNAAKEIVTVNPTDWLRECAETFKENYSPGSIYIDYSNFNLIDKPSGLCADHLSCAFEKCNRTGIYDLDRLMAYLNVTNGDDLGGALMNLTGDKGMGALKAGCPLFLINLTNSTYDDVKDILGPLNLPSKIAFPESVADVVDAVKYAKEQNLTVSIKTSGHSYTGSSTNKGSLQLNLRDLVKHSNTSIVECFNVNKENQDFAACKLAGDRGKKAIVRVGGGELWSDVYLSVLNANTSVRYDIVGGGSGSVGAAGGWLQGGGLSTGMDRMYGLGVDQVLELEMVLADGRHVKFGPSKWESAEGFLYPRTTVVSGNCNTNVTPYENEAVWKKCEDPVPPFADLWYAVRGGGGGTYGVVTSLIYQLHDFKPRQLVELNATIIGSIVAALGDNKEMLDRTKKMILFFMLDFLFNPSVIGVDEETSKLCGSSTLGSLDFSKGSILMFCYDDAAYAFQEAWLAKVDSEADQASIANELKNLWQVSPKGSFPEFAMSFLNNPSVPEGKIPDYPRPDWLPGKGFGAWCSVQIPLKWLQGKNEDVFNILKTHNAEHLTGGNVPFAHDQMTSVPQVERSSGISSTSFDGESLDVLEKLLSSFLNVTVQTQGYFPGITELNHLCPDSLTPMRKNMTAFCPSNYTDEQKKAECYSIQESIWGVDTLKKLEHIKYTVDPDNLFDCYACVKPKKASLDPYPISPPEDSDLSFSYHYMSFVY